MTKPSRSKTIVNGSIGRRVQNQPNPIVKLPSVNFRTLGNGISRATKLISGLEKQAETTIATFDQLLASAQSLMRASARKRSTKMPAVRAGKAEKRRAARTVRGPASLLAKTSIESVSQADLAKITKACVSQAHKRRGEAGGNHNPRAR